MSRRRPGGDKRTGGRGKLGTCAEKGEGWRVSQRRAYSSLDITVKVTEEVSEVSNWSMDTFTTLNKSLCSFFLVSRLT